MQPTKKVSPVIAALIVIVLIGVVVATVVIANQSKETSTVDTTKTAETESQNETTPTTSDSETATYKDGTYSEKGTYISPGGAESIEVKLTIANDIITDATVTGNATRGESKQYQGEFISGYKSQVVGKDVDSVSLSRVAGSSLTSNGFNTALKLIKADAGA